MLKSVSRLTKTTRGKIREAYGGVASLLRSQRGAAADRGLSSVAYVSKGLGVAAPAVGASWFVAYLRRAGRRCHIKIDERPPNGRDRRRRGNRSGACSSVEPCQNNARQISQS